MEFQSEDQIYSHVSCEHLKALEIYPTMTQYTDRGIGHHLLIIFYYYLGVGMGGGERTISV